MTKRIRVPKVFIQILGKKFTGKVIFQWDNGKSEIFFKNGYPIKSSELFQPFGKEIISINFIQDTLQDIKDLVNPLSIVYKGIELYDKQLLLIEAGELIGPYIKLHQNAVSYIPKFSFPKKAELISHLIEKEPFSHKELVEITQESEEYVLKVLYSLASCGFLMPENTSYSQDTLKLRVEFLKEYFLVKQQDPFEILGVSKDALHEEIEKAFRDKAKRLHPDIIVANGLENWREEAEDLFRMISEAYTLLSNEEERQKLLVQEQMQEVSGVVDSELFYQKGRIYLKQKEFGKAKKSFQKALEQVPNEWLYLAYLAWATYLAAENKSSVRTEVIGQLHKAVNESPRLAIGHYFLGKVLADAQLFNDAISHLEKAYRIDSNLIEAAREARLLKRRKTKSTSFTGRFFSFLKKE